MANRLEQVREMEGANPQVTTSTPLSSQPSTTGGPQQQLMDFFNLFGGGSNARRGGGGGGASKLKAIAKRELAFQKRTGLRDIEQSREAGLRAAVNNALQRGIFRSGIRTENEALVNREADEAASDLRSQIGFALERLNASGGGGGGGGGAGFTLPPNLMFQLALDFLNNSQQRRSGAGTPPPITPGVPS